MKRKYPILIVLFFIFLFWPKETFAANDCVLAVNSYGLSYKDLNGSDVNITLPGSQLNHQKPWPIIYNTAAQSNTLNAKVDVTAKYCDYAEFNFYLDYWDGSNWVRETQSSSQASGGGWWSASGKFNINPAAPRSYRVKMWVRGLDKSGDSVVSYWIEYRYFYFYYSQVTQNEATLGRVLNVKVTEPAYNDVVGFNSYGYTVPPKFYVLYDTNPAVRNNRSPDSREIAVPEYGYTSLTNFTGPPDWKMSVNLVNFPVPTNLVQGKTYYWRLRQQSDPSPSNNSGGSIGYIPGPASGFSYTIETPTKSTRDIRVFVTSSKYDGNLGGLSGADAKCQTRANAAGLGGTWRAWLSDAFTSAEDRMTHTTAKYKLLNGTVIANGWGDLTDGNLLNRINLTETNTTLGSGDELVWTNTLKTGDISDFRPDWECKGWTSTTDVGAVFGLANSIDSTWTQYNSIWCTNSSRLYCFEKPADATPLNQSTVYNKVFITSTNYTGNLGGTDGADAKCQTRADAAGLGGTWKAWLSSSTSSPDDRFVHSTAPYKLVDGATLIAYNWDDLTNGTIHNSINKDEFGNGYPTMFDSTTPRWEPWTNTSINGTTLTTYSCQDWTDGTGSYSGTYSYNNQTSSLWTQGYPGQNTDACSKSLKLYCFQQRAETAVTLPDYKRVFTTSTTYNGNLGGLSGADAKCQTRATAANLGGTWKAWLSDSATNVTSRLTHSTIPYTLVDGATLIANNWDDLTDGNIQHSINKDEFGHVANGTGNVWTGTLNNGAVGESYNCTNWSTSVSVFNTPTNSFDPSGLGIVGSSSDNYQWTQNNASSCGLSLRLYCLEESTQHNNTPTSSSEPVISTGNGTDNGTGSGGDNGTSGGNSSSSTTSSCAVQNDASSRATGLVSAPSLSGKFPNTSGTCVIDTKSAFAPFKIPQFDDLKSLYFDQKK